MLVDSLREGGGAERLVVAIATHLPPDRYDVTVCASRSSSPEVRDELEDAGVESFALDRSHRLDLLPFRELHRFLRTHHMDVLHSHKFGSNVWGALLAIASRRALVFVAHEHGWSYERRWRRLVNGLIGRAAAAFVAGTRADAARMVALEGIRPEKVVMIPGAYIPRPSKARGDLRGELGLAANVPLVGTIGILRSEKGYDVLLEAFVELSRGFPEAHLVIAGDGPCRPELERLSARLGVDSRTHFLGMRDDIATVLAAMEVATISSHRESTSLFALECMAHDVPLVSTRVGGPAEILEDGTSALLVPPGDPGALASGIGSLLGDPGRRRALALCARGQLDAFRIERVAALHGELYDRLLDAAA